MTAPVVAHIEQSDGVAIVRVQVEQLVDAPATELQRIVLAAAAELSALPFVLDLGRVAFMPSVSLAALVRISSDFRGRGRRLVLASLQPMVRQVITITRLDRLIESADSVDDAIRLARGDADGRDRQ